MEKGRRAERTSGRQIPQYLVGGVCYVSITAIETVAVMMKHTSVTHETSRKLVDTCHHQNR